MTAFLSSMAQPGFAQENPLGEFGAHTDVGDPKLAGSASYDAAMQEYTLTGAGSNMWVGRDEFQFVWKKMKGDFILRTRAEFIGKGAADHRKIGWMAPPQPGSRRTIRGLRPAWCDPHLAAVSAHLGRSYRTNRPSHHQCRCAPVREERGCLHLFRGPLRRAFRLVPTHQ